LIHFYKRYSRYFQVLTSVLSRVVLKVQYGFYLKWDSKRED